MACDACTCGDTPAPAQTCVWTHDAIMDTWDTSCGECSVFETEGPAANRFTFCPYCGLTLTEVTPEPEPEEDDDDGDN